MIGQVSRVDALRNSNCDHRGRETCRELRRMRVAVSEPSAEMLKICN